jgi:hypothetical protein
MILSFQNCKAQEMSGRIPSNHFELDQVFDGTQVWPSVGKCHDLSGRCSFSHVSVRALPGDKSGTCE